jgi:hypothetical protein
LDLDFCFILVKGGDSKSAPYPEGYTGCEYSLLLSDLHFLLFSLFEKFLDKSNVCSPAFPNVCLEGTVALQIFT